MEKSSEKYIGDSVYLINSRYSKLESKVKVLYFNYLAENKSPELFAEEVNKLWGDIDHTFMDKQIDKLKNIVHNNNIELGIDAKRLDNNKESYHTVGDLVVDDYFSLIPEKDFKKVEKRYIQRVISNYNRSYKSIQKQNKETYIEEKLEVYDEQINQVVAYYKKDTNKIARYVDVSTYLSMLHNVDLTRSAWNTTLEDSRRLGTELFIIPYHPFSCEYCQQYQNMILSRYEVEYVLGLEAEEQVGDILHPNCKCTLSIFWDNSQLQDISYTEEEQTDFYNIRQKVNNYSLKIQEMNTDKKIIEAYGNAKQLDKIKKRIKDTRQKMKDLVNTLPTEELQKEVRAIYR